MRKTKAIKASRCVLVSILTMCMMSAYAFADTAQISKSKTATALDSGNQTKVTLSLPAGTFTGKAKADVVFVVDTSAGSDYADYEKQASTLLDKISANTNVDAKVGTVVFDGWGHDGYSLVTGKGDGVSNESGLVEMNSSTLPDLKKAVVANTKTDYIRYHVAHSNSEQPIRMAKRWLDADKSVAQNNKYVVVISDWLTYVYGGSVDVNGTSYGNVPVTKNFGGDGLYLQQVPTDKRNLTQLFADYDSGTLQKDATYNRDTFDEYGPFGAYWKIFFDQIYANSGETGPGMITQDQYNKMLAAADCGTKGITSYEKSIALTRDALLKCTNSGYNVYTYTDDESYATTYDKDFNNMPADFGKWLSSTSGIKNVLRSSDTDMDNFFDDIESSIINLFENGTVSDTIADKFTLVEKSGSSPFTLNVGGTELKAVETGTDQWSFGTKDAEGVYPYAVTYDRSTKTFTWKINVPVEIAKKVQLSYDLQLNDLSKSGKFPTNKIAAVSYYDGTGRAYQETFDVPYVTYTKAAGDTTKKTPTKNTNGPRTGDTGNLPFWMFVGGAAAVAAGALEVKRKKAAADK